jgi:hypothetical protein
VHQQTVPNTFRNDEALPGLDMDGSRRLLFEEHRNVTGHQIQEFVAVSMPLALVRRRLLQKSNSDVVPSKHGGGPGRISVANVDPSFNKATTNLSSENGSLMALLTINFPGNPKAIDNLPVA